MLLTFRQAAFKKVFFLLLEPHRSEATVLLLECSCWPRPHPPLVRTCFPKTGAAQTDFKKDGRRTLLLTTSFLTTSIVYKYCACCECLALLSSSPPLWARQTLCNAAALTDFSVCRAESGCLTHTPSSLLSRRRSSAILLTGSSLPARESSPPMSPLVMNHESKYVLTKPVKQWGLLRSSGPWNTSQARLVFPSSRQRCQALPEHQC